MFKKPKVINPNTPAPEVDPEAIQALREINKELSGCESFDPREVSELQTHEMPAVSKTTSGSMRALPPGIRYTIASKSPNIFGELQSAACECINKQQRIPSGFILSVPLYEKLEWHDLTPKPFSRTYLFIIAGMIKHRSIPIYRDADLPANVILCLLP
jgi:hypothetical protein